MRTSVGLQMTFAVLTVLMSSCVMPGRQHLRGSVTSLTTLEKFSRQSIDAANDQQPLTGTALCDVSIVQITYDSIGVHGEHATLSAGIYVPERCPGPFPILAQAHGTQSERRTLSTDVDAADLAITFFAARGYLVVVTDYLGLGKSDYLYHPYLHADSEASAIIDAIRAARTASLRLGVPLDGKVMLYGYSQGGHAAMAAQREIERHHRDEFNLVASAPMAGPYNLSQTFLGAWFGYTAGQPNTLASELFAYTAVSYNRAYGTLYRRPEQLFSKRYANDVENIFSGALDISEIISRQLLPPGHRLDDLRNPEFTAAFLLDANEPMRVALRKNDLLDWTPIAATLLCGSRRDSIVDLQNAYAAQASFRARGVDVPVVDVADELPDSADGELHHRYSVPCYARARTQLFDPIAKPSVAAD